jgi:hypothetical protein
VLGWGLVPNAGQHSRARGLCPPQRDSRTMALNCSRVCCDYTYCYSFVRLTTRRAQDSAECLYHASQDPLAKHRVILELVLAQLHRHVRPPARLQLWGVGAVQAVAEHQRIPEQVGAGGQQPRSNPSASILIIQS